MGPALQRITEGVRAASGAPALMTEKEKAGPWEALPVRVGLPVAGEIRSIPTPPRGP
jgi:hypothetical protein